MKLELLNPHLAFVPLERGNKIHDRHIPSSRGDLSHSTFCGRLISEDVPFLPERELDVTRICGRCYRSLRTYSETIVRLNQKKIVS
jgi:hypothetical protein